MWLDLYGFVPFALKASFMGIPWKPSEAKGSPDALFSESGEFECCRPFAKHCKR